MNNSDRNKFVRHGFAAVIAALCSIYTITSIAQGLLPVPSMSDVGLEPTISVLSGTVGDDAEYTYDYTVRSGAANDGLIWMFKLDISVPFSGRNRGETFPVQGGVQTASWQEEIDQLEPFDGLHGPRILRVTQVLPAGWNGGAAKDGFAQFAAAGDTALIGPGESLGGFNLISGRSPTIRSAVIIPQWFLLVDDIESDIDYGVTDVEALLTESSLRTEVRTLGPSKSGLSEFAIALSLQKDLPEALTLGWVTNTTLATTIETALDNGIAALQAQDGDLAKTHFQSIIDTIGSADPSDFTSEYEMLVELNAVELLARTSPTPTPFEPTFSFVTNADTLSVGETFTITARYVNVANNDEPIAGFFFEAECELSFSCANFGRRSRVTDANGEAIISFVGRNPGVDRIGLGRDPEVPDELGVARIEWTGGPDLVVPLFVPPIIDAEAGETIFLTDTTMNQGNLPAGESITRYYISNDDPIDIASAQVIGERIVGALEPDEVSNSFEVPYTIPNNFARGLHYLAACADANSSVVELIESNNCSFVALDTFITDVEPGQFVGFASSFSVGDASVIEGNAGLTALEFTVSIDQADPSETVSVIFSTVDGSATVADGDYTSQSGSVVFPANTTEFTQIVSVPVNGDFRVEADETFSLILSDPTGSSDISDGEGIGTIFNDDLSAIQISNVTAPEGDSGTTPFVFDVTIDQAHPTEDIIVSVATQDGTALENDDYLPNNNEFTFSAGTLGLSQQFVVSVNGDTELESDETFTVNLSGASANAFILNAQGDGVIINDDAPVILSCEGAIGAPNTLWPPNHKLVDIEIKGVFDENHNEASIIVTSIFQDEAIDGEGDGDTSPDGFGVGTDTAQVRRERSGLGDGRIYIIGFDAMSTSGASCSGEVAIGVPHDQGQGSTPIDSGLRIDSTVP